MKLYKNVTATVQKKKMKPTELDNKEKKQQKSEQLHIGPVSLEPRQNVREDLHIL